MRKLFSCAMILMLCAYYSTSKAQNLVSNPSFELYNNCPIGTSGSTSGIIYDPTFTNFPTVRDWVTPLRTTPDYFNSCANSSSSPLAPQSMVPTNTFGTMQPHSGNGYAGMYVVSDIQGVEVREYVETKLLQPMVAGKEYLVSFYISRAGLGKYTAHAPSVAIARFGALFTDTMVKDPSLTTYSLNMAASVENPANNYITDTTQWTRVEVFYVAHGGERWLTFGHFADKPSTFIVVPPDSSYNKIAYMYLDDVCVANSIITKTDSVIKCSSKVKLQAHSGTTNYIWSTGDSSANINVNTSGTYWVKSWGACSFYIDTFKLTFATPPVLNIGKDSTYCKGQIGALSSNYNYYTAYSWNTGATTPSIPVTQTGQYILTVTDSCGAIQKDTANITFHAPPMPVANDTTICLHTSDVLLNVKGDLLTWYPAPDASTGTFTQPAINTSVPGVQILYVSNSDYCGESDKATIKVAIKTAPDLIVSGDTLACNNQPVALKALSNEPVSYLWSTGSTDCCISVNQPGYYKVSVTGKCGTTDGEHEVKYHDCMDCIWVPTAFTPNQDGKNDVFHIVNKCPIGGFHIQIVNRWGQVVFESFNIDNSWDGTFGGKPAEVGTYFYTLYAFPNLEGAERQITQKGDVTLIR